MNPVYSEFVASVAQQIGPEQAKALAARQRFCGKLRHWCDADGGTGSGRQWRCASCAAHRRAAMAIKKAQA